MDVSTATVRSGARIRSPLPDGIENALKRDRRAVEQELAAWIGSRRTRIDVVARNYLLDGGKRVRPLLTCAVLRALGEDPEPHMGLVAAVELAHAGTLLHDDVIDDSPTRRSRPTGHVVFDVPTAILAGDRLVMRAVEQVARHGPRRLLVAFSEAMQALCTGESLERERRHDLTVRLEQVRRVNRLKTASLFAYAAEAGAILAGASPRECRAACAYGSALGEAFQTVDDRLDFCGDPDVLGKPIGQDLVAGVITIPVAIALARSPALGAEVLGLWRASGSEDAAARLAALRHGMDGAGALAETARIATADADRAADALLVLPQGPWRDGLCDLARTLVRRKM